MKTQTIYVVRASIPYEGGNAVRAYDDESEAKAFAEKCNNHEEERDDCADYEEWWKNHPAGTHAYCDFDVIPLTLFVKP